MAPAAGDGYSKSFSDTLELYDLYYSTILDCQAKTGNIFTKIVSDKEIAVYGDYKVLVFFRRSYVGEEKSYSSITVRKNICEMVPFAATENTQVRAELLLRPSCDYKYLNYDHNRSCWKIEVQGEIRFTGTIPKTSAAADTAEAKRKPYVVSQENSEAEQEERVWQFEGNDDIPVEQLMEMDLDSLIHMDK